MTHPTPEPGDRYELVFTADGYVTPANETTEEED
jgi:hypothetical protein